MPEERRSTGGSATTGCRLPWTPRGRLRCSSLLLVAFLRLLQRNSDQEVSRDGEGSFWRTRGTGTIGPTHAWWKRLPRRAMSSPSAFLGPKRAKPAGGRPHRFEADYFHIYRHFQYAPGRTRTSDRRLRRPLLCPLSYGRPPRDCSGRSTPTGAGRRRTSGRPAREPSDGQRVTREPRTALGGLVSCGDRAGGGRPTRGGGPSGVPAREPR